MKLLLVTNHFWPETFRCNELAFDLARRGHRVTVLTGIPDYPQGRFHKGYGVFRKRKEVVQGVTVYRSFIIPRGKGGALRMVLNYASSLAAQCWDAVWLGLFGRYDRVLVHETSPVMVGVPGVIVSRTRRIPMDFWVLDLWPESLEDGGGIHNPRILGAFGKLTTWIYRHSDHILMSSRGFRASICEKGDFADKLIYFPNWADAALEESSDYEIPAMPQGFRFLFAGNLGEAQDMDNLLAAALALKDEKDLHFCLVGDGRKRPWVEAFVREHGLEATVHLMGQHPVTAMPAFFAVADVLLVTLKDSPIFNRTAPAKIQAYMHAGKPLAAMISGEGAAVIAEAACGRSVPAGDAQAFAGLLRTMKAMDPAALREMGAAGQRYCAAHFDFKRSVDTIERLMDPPAPAGVTK